MGVRDRFQQYLGIPVEQMLLAHWETERTGRAAIERRGLPRRAVEQRLGEALILHVDPRELIRINAWKGYPHRERPSSSAFIWDGEWDLRRGDLRYGPRYRFISELDVFRDDLRQTARFKELNERLQAGRPWSSHQQGILLDTEAKILTYLRAYLSFLDNMAVKGFDAGLGKDDLGVAVTREGRLIKINRGLHRLAMAQRLGLPSVPVRVKAVHREWWQRVTQGAQGTQALERGKDALQRCVPETEPGELDPEVITEAFQWPVPRVS
ncbi:hypothetical protein R5M92_00070 [Halomonas sp. Bachu 37]|uniref:hypothetical protein n=1 Tax=Halomonas kashgarensis TaxID=3084920 RepID=UPI003217D51F